MRQTTKAPPGDLSFVCDAEWAEMDGDEAVRHCARCDTRVHNLSVLTQAEAKAFVRRAPAGTCGAYALDEAGAPTFQASSPFRRMAAQVLQAAMAVSALAPASALLPACESKPAPKQEIRPKVAGALPHIPMTPKPRPAMAPGTLAVLAPEPASAVAARAVAFPSPPIDADATCDPPKAVADGAEEPPGKPLTKAQILLEVRLAAASFRECRTAGAEPTSGTVIVVMTIEPDGRVLSAEPRAAEPLDRKVKACLQDAVRAIRFPKADVPTRLHLPIVL